MEKEPKESALWHRVSGREKEEIKQSAKKIMDSFASSLEEIEKKAPETAVERDEFERQETKETEKTDSDFREIMFRNAPKTKNDCIEAEKGGWAG
ncbi:hypothetical protein HYT26_00275 [Candidatus Pacearchaeota archaeon]|nr:hypothetical protein [Candidatus Pacearchaeota archaeon]